MQISNIFKSVWTSPACSNPINSPVRMVLGGQAARSVAFDNPLTYISKEYGPPKDFFYSLAIAPYVEFNHMPTSTATPTSPRPRPFRALPSSIAHYQSTGVFKQAFDLAKGYGLKLDAYEAGEDTYGPLNIPPSTGGGQPAEQGLMEQFLNLWYSSGGDQLNWYTLCARSYNTQYGSWSITDNITNYNAAERIGVHCHREGVPLKVS